MVAGAYCLRVGDSVDAGLSPIDVLERCDRRGDIFSGRAVVFIEALCIHPLQLQSKIGILSESLDGLGYPILQKGSRLVKLLEVFHEATREIYGRKECESSDRTIR